MRRLLSHVNLLNILLAGLLALAAQRTIMPFLSADVKSVLPAPKKTAAPQPPAQAKPAETKNPSPADYVVIAEQNLFHPDRKIPVEKKEAQPLPKPEFVLYGTVRAGDVNIAYMEDRKHPVSTPTRGKKQIPLQTGQSLSGFTLQTIEADKVVMQRGEEKIVVQLNDSHSPKTREAAAVAPAGGPPAAATAQQAVQQRAARRQEAQATRQAQTAQPEAPAATPQTPAASAAGAQPAVRPQRPENPVNIFKNFLKPKQ